MVPILNLTNYSLCPQATYLRIHLLRPLPASGYARRYLPDSNQAYELAKVQEAKEIPPIKVLGRTGRAREKVIPTQGDHRPTQLLGFGLCRHYVDYLTGALELMHAGSHAAPAE